MDHVLVNGDSYSAPTDHKVYGDFVGEKWNCPVVNIAIEGSNNDRISRSTVEYVESLPGDIKPFVIIGWSFIRRLEVWYYGDNNNILHRIPDKTNNAVYNKFVTLDFLINQNEATLEQKCLVQEDLFVHKQLIEFYTKIFFLANYLESKKIDYLFFSGAKNCEVPIHCFPSIEKMNMVQKINNNKKIYNLHDFYIMDYAFKNDPHCNKDTGHLSEVGHRKFSQYMLENMI